MGNNNRRRTAIRSAYHQRSKQLKNKQSDEGIKFYMTPEFKKLQAFWYKKLKESGFSDAEKGEDQHWLTLLHNQDWTREVLQRQVTKSNEIMFRMASWWLHRNPKFADPKNEKLKTIWQMFIDGWSARNTSKWIRENKPKWKKRSSNWYISKVIRDMKKEMLSSPDIGLAFLDDSNSLPWWLEQKFVAPDDALEQKEKLQQFEQEQEQKKLELKKKILLTEAAQEHSSEIKKLN